MQHGSGPYRFFAGVFIIVYGALGAGCWFFLCYVLIGIFSKHLQDTYKSKMVCWIAGSWLYFWFVDRAFFSIFGFFEGDQLRFLLLPLAIRPQWLVIAQYLTRFGGLLLLLIFSASSACFFIGDKKKSFFSVAFVCFLPFVAGWFYPRQEHQDPNFISTIACLIPSIEQKDPWLVHEHICELLTKCSDLRAVKTIILPESSFQFPLEDWERNIAVWYNCIKRNDVYIILGSHRRDDQSIYNTLYVLHNCRIIQHYDKIHAMFFTERLPPLWSHLKETKNLFLKNTSPFCQGRKKRLPIFFSTLGFVRPYICSDLFFEPIASPRSKNDTNTLLCLVNDSWFSVGYIPDLMFLQAISKSLYEKCSILYVSYTKSEFIFQDGFSTKLLTILG